MWRTSEAESFRLRYRYKDRKSTRLNSSHLGISYAVFCLKKNKNNTYAQGCDTESEGSAACVHSVRYQRQLPGVLQHRGPAPVDPRSCLCSFFFFNDPAPPEFSPFPLPAPFPI